MTFTHLLSLKRPGQRNMNDIKIAIEAMTVFAHYYIFLFWI